jgi:hypothetical protein
MGCHGVKFSRNGSKGMIRIVAGLTRHSDKIHPSIHDMIRMGVLDEALYLLEDLPAALLSENKKLRRSNKSSSMKQRRASGHDQGLREGKGKDATNRDRLSPAVYSAASTASFESSLCENSPSSSGDSSTFGHGEEGFTRYFGCFNLHDPSDYEHLPPPSPPSPPNTRLQATTILNLRTHPRTTNTSNSNPGIHSKQDATESFLAASKGIGTQDQPRRATYSVSLADFDSTTSTDTQDLNIKAPIKHLLEISTSLTQLLARSEQMRQRKDEDPSLAASGLCGDMHASESSKQKYDKTRTWDQDLPRQPPLAPYQLVGSQRVELQRVERERVERERVERERVGMQEICDQDDKKDVEGADVMYEESIFACWMATGHACV